MIEKSKSGAYLLLLASEDVRAKSREVLLTECGIFLRDDLGHIPIRPFVRNWGRLRQVSGGRVKLPFLRRRVRIKIKYVVIGLLDRRR
jgi:hypothetical protein